jgi:hypothetical protein
MPFFEEGIKNAIDKTTIKGTVLLLTIINQKLIFVPNARKNIHAYQYLLNC